MSMEISYSEREYKEALDAVVSAENSDAMPIYVWARYAKILADKNTRLRGLLRENVELLYTIKNHYAVNEITTQEMMAGQ